MYIIIKNYRYNNIDLKEATKLGIPIGNTPDVLSDATADIAFALLICTARYFKKFYKFNFNQLSF